MNLEVWLKHSMDALVWWSEKKILLPDTKKNHVGCCIHSNPIQNHIWIFELPHFHTEPSNYGVFICLLQSLFGFLNPFTELKNPVRSPHTFFRSLKSTSSHTFTLNAEYFPIQRDKRPSVFLCVKKLRWSGVLEYTRFYVGCFTGMMVWEKTGR